MIQIIDCIRTDNKTKLLKVLINLAYFSTTINDDISFQLIQHPSFITLMIWPHSMTVHDYSLRCS